jgi:lipopolysaccharide transport system ATP-binding protein
MTPSIRIQELGKNYRVNHAEQRAPYKTLRDSISRIATAPIRRWRAGGHYGVVEQFWALQDVNVDVQPGEVVGIIGRNGAGKSTLLKILSRITGPTTGHVEIRGRVGSLLEVGTGFHPELTGRENIYMNGSILGMSRCEIRSKFDEIVDFSGVEKFLDTPVKRYSSGMQVRLAFAVAAHLEPEVIVVDEVLAVGDVEFQKKCLGKMGDVARSGRTVLFVSHQLPAIEALCSRVLVLEAGKTYFDGPSSDGVDAYLDLLRSHQGVGSLANRTDRNGSGVARYRSLGLLDSFGRLTDRLSSGGPMEVEAVIECHKPLKSAQCIFIFSTIRGQRVFRLATQDHGFLIPTSEGSFRLRCQVPAINLMPGGYTVSLRLLSMNELVDEVQDAAQFSVVARDHNGSGKLLGTHQDLIFYPCQWSHNELDSAESSSTEVADQCRN